MTKIIDITSAQNAQYRIFARLLTGRGMKKEGMAILSGKKQVNDALSAFPGETIGWITPNTKTPPPPGREHLVWYRIAPELFSELDANGTGPPLLLLRTPSLPIWKDEGRTAWPKGMTLFIPLQDPTNVGAVIRSAVAFGAARVVLLEEAASPYHHKSVRASGGSVFSMPLLRGPSVYDLSVSGAPLFSLDQKGHDITRIALPPTMALLVGIEGPGLPERFRGKYTLSIPMAPGVESLNGAVALSIALFEWRKRNVNI